MPSPGLSRTVQNRTALAINTQTTSVDLRPQLREVESAVKHCSFHNKAGHSLEECKAFVANSLQKRTEWIYRAKLWFQCFSGEHLASSCKRQVKCSSCEDGRHSALLHKEKQHKVTRSNETVNTRSTFVCSANEGSVS